MESQGEQSRNGERPELPESGTVTHDTSDRIAAASSPEGWCREDHFFDAQAAEFKEHQRRMAEGTDYP
jgi:hypothetical protein